MSKIKAAIIGTGNIGTDILIKLQRSELIECSMFVGRSLDSEGIKLAKIIGVNTSVDSIDAIKNNPTGFDFIFDATSAKDHLNNWKILKRMNKFTIDLTPSNVGKSCIPVLNLKDCLAEKNVNLITCGGQATIPIAHAISKEVNVTYIEIVASIASKSAGIGTRNNIDEFTQTTKEALKNFTSVNNTKAIIILNPAEPPITMRNTIYTVISDANPNMELIRKKVAEMSEKIKKYVPGYNVVLPPVFDGNKIITTIEVVGRGDYIPAYAGNLDIITCAAIEVAESYALMKKGELQNE